MKPERWQELDQLFHSALAHRAEERSVFLDEACAGDEKLHQQIEALLAAHQEAGSFIESPAFEVEARAVAEDHNQLSMGQTIGHYRILSLLGAGGMGEVYLAEDTTLGRKVALKLLPADFTRDINRVRRFQQEAQAASALNHPNIVTVYEIGHIGDRHLIATEFIDGETLRERIRGDSSPSGSDEHKPGTSIPLVEVLNIGIQVADALAAAHEAGIVHRDIKPENIMVRRRDGYIKVLDFGLAKLTSVGSGGVDREAATRPQVKTSAGMVMGTVSYMSPEQTRGEQVDARTDIWSLGVVLYELVAGYAPFDRPTPSEVIAAILEHDPPPLADYGGQIPSELQRIINKALTKDREQRYQTAKDVLTDLRSLHHDVEIASKMEVSTIPESGERQPIESSPKAITTAISAGEIPRRVTRQKRNLVLAGVVTLVVVVLIAAVIYRLYLPAGATAFDSIAVLPLENATGDKETEYLSDGISESLINSLAELQQLRVIARATAFRYKGKDVDPQAVGRELDVRAVLMGRMRQVGDTLSIQVDLVDTATGAQLWGREYQRKVPDLLSVKQLIAREVTGKLGLGLSGEQQQKLGKGDTTNPEAYQSYMRGLYFLRQRNTPSKAIEQFEQAIGLDPSYALAYVGIANSYLYLERIAGTPSSETLPKARAAVERALAIDDSLAEVHTPLAQIEERSWNFDASEKEYKRAIALNPNLPGAHHWYSMYLRDVRGRFDEALAEIQIAQRLDPLSPGTGAAVAGTLYVNGKQDAAFQEAKKVIELDPTVPVGHFTLGMFYRLQRRYEEAIAEEEKAVELSGRASLHVSVLGACYAETGNRARALELLKELEEKYNKREASGLFIAYVHVALGDKDQAFAWLEKDFQAHNGRLPSIAHFPMLETLRDDPRWKDLLRRIGLPRD